MIFVIGCILEIIVCLLAAVIPTLYTQSYKHGSISGVGSFLDQGKKYTYTLSEMYGAFYIIAILVIIAVCVLYIVFYFTKKQNIIPNFVITLVFLLPVALMFFAMGELGSDAKAIGNSIATYTEGTDSGLTGFGFLALLGFIVAPLLTGAGLIINKEEQRQNPEKNVQEIKVKPNKKAQNVSSDDWNF